jgi:hypothetical protein
MTGTFQTQMLLPRENLRKSSTEGHNMSLHTVSCGAGEFHVKIITMIMNFSVPRVLTFLLALVSTQMALGASFIETKYGKVEVVSEGDNHAILFKEKKIAIFEGSDVALSRITSAGPKEYLVMDIGQNGLYCRHKFSLLEISPQFETIVSKPFGECTELHGTKYLLEGALIELRGAVAGKTKQKISKYLWSNEKIKKQ